MAEKKWRGKRAGRGTGGVGGEGAAEAPPPLPYPSALRREYSHKNWVEVCGPLPETLSKIFDFPYPITVLINPIVRLISAVPRLT